MNFDPFATVGSVSTDSVASQVSSLRTDLTLLPMGVDSGNNNNHAQPPQNDPFSGIDIGGLQRTRMQSSAQTQHKTAEKVKFLTVDSGGGKVAHDQKHQNAQLLKTHFVQIRDILLDDEDTQLLKTFIDDVEDFSINFSMETAEYKDPVTGDRKVIDLKNLEDPKVQQYVDAFMKLADETLSITKHRSFTLSAKGKGNVNGPRALQRDGSPALKGLPKTFGEATKTLLPQLLMKIENPEVRRKVFKRVVRAEYIQQHALKELNREIGNLDKDYRKLLDSQKTDLSVRKEVNDLQKQLLALRALKSELEGLDAAALVIAFAHFPTDPAVYQQSREDAAQEAIKFTEAHLNANDEKRTDDAAVHHEKVFAKGVGGLMHQIRWHFKKYTESQDIPFTKDGIEDVIMRGVIQFERAEMKGKDFTYDPVYLYENDFVTPEIQKEATQIFKGAQDGFFFDLQSFGPTAFQLQAYPQGATDKDKQLIDGQNKAVVDSEIERVRQAAKLA